MSTPKRFHRLRAVLDRRQPDLTVLLEDVQVPRNLAAILRSCDAVGVLEAHAVWPGGRLKISRPASGGNLKWLPVHKHRTLAEALASADAVVTIPMEGMGTSLNVSVAAALMLFEAQRQRRAAGLYDAPRVDTETYNRLLFEWVHPGIAAQCRKRGAGYPELGEDGEILGTVPR